MRLETSAGHFELGHDGPDDLSYYFLDAATSSYDGAFAVRHNYIVLDTDAETRQRVAAFAGFATSELELTLGGGGWLRVVRRARGDLDWRWRVVDLSKNAACEGQLSIDGEWANDACRQLVGMLL